MSLQHLASNLKVLRKKHGISLNALSKLSGISRRTLARLEAGQWAPLHPERSRRASRTTMKLLRLFLSPDQIASILTDATRLSAGYAAQLGGDPQSYALIDILPDLYPYFLFHPPKNELDKFIRKEYGPDYRSSLHQLVIRPLRNLGLRLRAFRLRHDLTLVQTAALLGLSKSELHRIERNQRKPSAQSAYKILRLLTAPQEGGAALQPGWVYPEGFSEGVSPSQARRAGTENAPDTSQDLGDPLDSLRRLWLSGGLKTRDLAATLGISPPHLIRLLRGDRNPSKRLLERIPQLAAR